MVTNKMNILAIGAHWDEIELGCGLTLKKLKENGHNIFTVVVCSSQYGQDVSEGMKESEALECGLKSFELIGANYIKKEKEQNSNLVYNKKTMQTLETIVNDNNIDTVFTHWHTVYTVYYTESKTPYSKETLNFMRDYDRLPIMVKDYDNFFFFFCSKRCSMKHK